jgi:PPOX class probable F420-dependent enzyme
VPFACDVRRGSRCCRWRTLAPRPRAVWRPVASVVTGSGRSGAAGAHRWSWGLFPGRRSGREVPAQQDVDLHRRGPRRASLMLGTRPSRREAGTMSEIAFAGRSSRWRQAGAEMPVIPAKYLSITSFRRDGTGVATPVWFVQEGGRLLVQTGASSGKVKRIGLNPQVMIAPCGGTGRLRAEPVPGAGRTAPRCRARLGAAADGAQVSDRLDLHQAYPLAAGCAAPGPAARRGGCGGHHPGARLARSRYASRSWAVAARQRMRIVCPPRR